MNNLKVAGRGKDSNILHVPLGPIPSNSDLIRRLKKLPREPVIKLSADVVERLYELRCLNDLRVPSTSILELARAIDASLDSGYRARDPDKKSIWGQLFSDVYSPLAIEPASAVFVSGASGTGKTICFQMTLGHYPQVYEHPRFPGCADELRQLCWIYVQAPASGSLGELLAELVNATAYALGAPELIKMFPSKGNVEKVFMGWMRYVQSHYLGVLVIDEIQNLFKLPTVTARSTKKGKAASELRLSDDKTLKMLMKFIDISGIPLILSGTPDADAFLRKRFAVSQRFTTGGRIGFQHAENADCEDFQNLLRCLEKYQWSDEPLVITEDIRKLIHSATAGIRRLVITLWKASQRIAFENGARSLNKEHILAAIAGPLADIQAAVAAILSGSPQALRQYEDLHCGT